MVEKEGYMKSSSEGVFARVLFLISSYSIAEVEVARSLAN